MVTTAVALLLAASGSIHAQFYTYGNVGADVDWRQLKSDHFTLIYPSEADSLARRYLFLMERDRENIISGYDIDPGSIPVVLRTYNTTAKGMTTWAPSRVEITTTPSAYSSYAQRWEERQVLHEVRHIPQMAIYTSGFFGVLEKFIGQSSLAIGMGFQPTAWLQESDAIISETVLSDAGRGRDATFLMPFRTAFLSGDFKEYDLWRYGSYYYFKPDNGQFGYMVGSFMRLNTDNWNVVNDQMSLNVKYWWNWNQWTFAFKDASGGMTARRNYRAARSMFTNLWRDDDRRRGPFTPYERISPVERNYTDYNYLTPQGDGSAFAVRSGYERPSQLVRISPDGKASAVRSFAATTSRLAAGKNGLYWSETVPDVRWNLKEWSVIRHYDTLTGKVRDITSRTRLFNPSVSPDEKEIAATCYPVEGGSSLVILDPRDGGTVDVFPAPHNGQLTESAWTSDGSLYAFATVDEGEGIYRLDREARRWTEVAAPQRKWMTSLSAADSLLWFSWDLDGVSNIYSFNPADGTFTKVTNSRFGAFQPTYSPCDGTLHYSEYALKGYVGAVAGKEAFDGRRADPSQPFRHTIAEMLTEQNDRYVTPVDSAGAALLEETIAALPSRNYSEAGHLFRFHSWAPFYYNIDRFMNDLQFDEFYQLIAPGVTLISQNTLGTATSFIGYAWHNGRHTGHFNFEYSGLWPVFEFNLDLNDRPRTDNVFDFSRDTTLIPSVDASLNVYLPLDFSSSGWKRTFKPQLRYEWHNDRYCRLSESIWHHRQALDYSILYESVRPRTKAAIYPSLGFGAILSGRTAVGPENDFGTTLFGKIYGYTPGFIPGQGFKLTFQYQKQKNALAGYYMGNLCAMPRGYRTAPSEQYFKATADYAIPIPLGEANLAFLYYLMRLKLIPFTDFAVNEAFGQKELMFSYGAAALVDCHIFRIGWELGFGVRYARTLDGRNSFSFVTNVPLK